LVRRIARQVPRSVVSITRVRDLVVRGVKGQGRGAGRPPRDALRAAHVPIRVVTVPEGKPHGTQAVPWLPAPPLLDHFAC
jgi:hypothetical protein